MTAYHRNQALVSVLGAFLVACGATRPNTTTAHPDQAATSVHVVAPDVVVAEQHVVTSEAPTEPALAAITIVPQWTHRSTGSVDFTPDGHLVIADEAGHFASIDGDTGLVRHAERRGGGRFVVDGLSGDRVVTGFGFDLAVHSVFGGAASDLVVPGEPDEAYVRAVSPNGTRFLLSSNSREYLFVENEEGQFVLRNQVDLAAARHMYWVTRHRLITVGGGTVGRDAGNFRPVWSVEENARHLASSPDGRVVYLVIGSALSARATGDGRLLWERKIELAHTDPSNRVYSLGVSADGSRVFVGGRNASLVFPSDGDGDPREVAVRLLSIIEEGALAVHDDDFVVYDLAAERVLAEVTGGGMHEVGPGGRVAILGSPGYRDAVHYWDGETLREYPAGTEHSVWFTSAHPEGSGVVFGGRFGVIVADRDGVREIACEGSPFYGLSWERMEVYAGTKRCDLRTGRDRTAFARGGLRWASPEGRYLLSGRGVLLDQRDGSRRRLPIDWTGSDDVQATEDGPPLFCDGEACGAATRMVDGALYFEGVDQWLEVNLETGEVTNHLERPERSAPARAPDADGPEGWRANRSRQGVVVTRPDGETRTFRSVRSRPRPFTYATAPDGRFLTERVSAQEVVRRRLLAVRDAEGATSVVSEEAYDPELLRSFFTGRLSGE